MATYTFVCSLRHASDMVFPAGRHPKTVRCDHPGCQRRARFDFRATFCGISFANLEIPPHFNRSFGCRVESRKHLEALQKQHGTEPYSPAEVKGPSTGWA